MRISLLASTALAALALTGNALAGGGSYTFSGGTPAEQANVRKALEASAFPWSVVPAQIKIRMAPGFASQASRGTIWLDSDLVDAGQFAWGTIQHEYAHQVDFFLLDEVKRAALAPQLGGITWWQTGTTKHGNLTSERFASTLAWSYWPNTANSMKPESSNDESAAMEPAKFRTLLTQTLGVPDLVPAQPVEQVNTWAAPAKHTAAWHEPARARAVSGGRRSRP